MGCNCNDNPTNNCDNPRGVRTNCENPCGSSVTNTAACEALPSQIQNFSDAFFGTVVKTEVNGVVTWSLPCGLNTGLVNNPRAEGEGLACYFLRLFNDGIIGLTGPQGKPGNAGTDGHNAYTVTLHSFTQPTLGSPNVTVLTAYNPAIIAGMYVFIAGSGWYLVNNADFSGALSLTLTKTISTPPVGNVSAGKLVVSSGHPGASGLQGNPGPKGDKGDAGDNATALSTVNAFYYAPVGTDYPLPILYTAVNFVNSSPQVLLPDIGKYLVTAIITIVGKTGVAASDIASFLLHNLSTGDEPGSEKQKNFIVDTQIETITINVTLITTSANNTIALFGKCTTNAKIDVVALRTTLTAIRIS